MKKMLIGGITLMSVFALTACGGPIIDKDDSLWKLYYETTYKYDDKNRVIDTKHNYKHNYENSTYNIKYEYDNYDNIISETRDDVPEYKYSYKYDSNGNILSMIESMYYSSTDDYFQTEEYEYRYDLNGNKIYEECLSHGIRYTDIWEYDDNGNLLSHCYYGDTNYFDPSKTLYKYDNNNNCIECIEQEKYDTLWEDVEKTVYTYDSNNNCIESLTKKENNGSWENFKKTVYKYDKNGNLVKEIIQKWNIYKFEEINRIEFCYDNNEVSKEIYYYQYKGKMIKSSVSVLEHGENGKDLICMTYRYSSEDKKWTSDVKTEEKYDDNGNLIYKAIYDGI